MQPSEYVDVEGKAGEPVTLPIATGPATGHAWSLELPAGVERVEDGPERTVPDSGKLGGASGGYLRVAAPHGDYTIIARLARPWDQDHPVRVVGIHLHIA